MVSNHGKVSVAYAKHRKHVVTAVQRSSEKPIIILDTLITKITEYLVTCCEETQQYQ